MFSHDTTFEKALSFSRFDKDHFLATYSAHCFELEDETWPSAEHYYQSAKFAPGTYAQKIRQSATSEQAHKLGNVWWRRKREDFKQVRRTLMTRALYSKAIQNADVKEALLAPDDQLIIENSAYEHYWGIGRDQRGENMLGKIWMDIREKLRSELASVPTQGDS